MINYKGNFKCTVLSPNNLIFEREVQSLFLTGDRGEFELLAYHYPLLAVLVRSKIVVDWNEEISINGGIVRFFANECTIIVEEEIKKKK